MKHLVILADGFADQPIERLNGKTPMMVANTPHIDQLCEKSGCGYLKTVPDSLHPGSEVANMTIMGYDAERYYQGRGVLEAAALGIDIGPTDLVFRCNLVTVEAAKLLNHSAGHIETEEARELINALNEYLGTERVKFYAGVSYRHVMVIKGGKNGVECTPPHDVPGEFVETILPKPFESNDTVKLLRQLMFASNELLSEHPVNVRRRAKGLPVANMIWPWSPGFKPAMPTMKELYGIEQGVVISAVDLIHGLGQLGGLQSVFVEGATGLYTTNYTGKAQAALKALKEGADYVFLHIEAPDEAGHEGDVELKIKTLEDIDQKVVKLVLEYLSKDGEDVSVAFLPDHPTPCEIRTHTRDHVPFMIYRPGVAPDKVKEYNEESVSNGVFGFIDQTEFMQVLLSGKK
ncbi:cofactor-independent phosphoglycerate mutase [Carboxylicivirga sediminis]|uniref:Cofactor-independent phosphoglycerate mutase n=1 Tax=Carboxylicivirga sediminis TaxID=2006564 RepID=A0A941F3I8_9BACT|nr:cofactor-independent phosphoglycerate mutase [Carboxylicivirga sediminis]MBR8535762.1 cofactor-independent phosphoglycerate mutase [Carboxylicivirga sediminis]